MDNNYFNQKSCPITGLPNTDGTSGQVLSTYGSGNVSWSTASTGFKTVNVDNMGPSYTITDAHHSSIIYDSHSLNVSSSLSPGFSCDYIMYSNHGGTVNATSAILYTKGSSTATNSVSVAAGDHIRIQAVASDKVFVTVY